MSASRALLRALLATAALSCDDESAVSAASAAGVLCVALKQATVRYTNSSGREGCAAGCPGSAAAAARACACAAAASR